MFWHYSYSCPGIVNSLQFCNHMSGYQHFLICLAWYFSLVAVWVSLFFFFYQFWKSLAFLLFLQILPKLFVSQHSILNNLFKYIFQSLILPSIALNLLIKPLHWDLMSVKFSFLALLFQIWLERNKWNSLMSYLEKF